MELFGVASTLEQTTFICINLFYSFIVGLIYHLAKLGFKCSQMRFVNKFHSLLFDLTTGPRKWILFLCSTD